MNDFSASELSGMRSVQTDSLQDECYIGRVSTTLDKYNEAVITHNFEATATACGLDMRPGSERYNNRMNLTQYDATVRLAITVNVSVKDQIKVTKRFGETLATPLIFEVIAPMQRGVSGIRLMLKRIEI